MTPWCIPPNWRSISRIIKSPSLNRRDTGCILLFPRWRLLHRISIEPWKTGRRLRSELPSTKVSTWCSYPTPITNSFYTSPMPSINNLPLREDITPVLFTVVTSSISYDLKVSDNNNIVELTGTVSCRIPKDLPIGFSCTVVNAGSGTITFTAATGITILSKSSAVTVATQHTCASVFKTGDSTIRLIGDLA